VGSLAAQDDPPGALREVVQLRPRRLDRSQAQACGQHEDYVVAETPGPLMSHLSTSPCTLFVVIAFGIPVS
jgi:hypothetical protein